jgi:two-component system response regulator DevR
MKRRLRVLLVDDHEVVRHGLRRMLETEVDMEVVGECTTAEEAFSQVEKLSPDVVIMDAQMPGINGIEATRRLKGNKLHYDGDIIVLADCTDYLIESMGVGAASYLLKDIRCKELVDTIREVYRNEHPPEGKGGLVEEEIELVIHPSTDAAQLMRFTNQVEKRLHASILQTVGSWDWGTAITILLKPDTSSNLLHKLGDIPDVEKVEAEPLTRDNLSGFLKKFITTPRSRTSTKERFMITLK